MQHKFLYKFQQSLFNLQRSILKLPQLPKFKLLSGFPFNAATNGSKLVNSLKFISHCSARYSRHLWFFTGTVDSGQWKGERRKEKKEWKATSMAATMCAVIVPVKSKLQQMLHFSRSWIYVCVCLCVCVCVCGKLQLTAAGREPTTDSFNECEIFFGCTNQSCATKCWLAAAAAVVATPSACKLAFWHLFPLVASWEG